MGVEISSKLQGVLEAWRSASAAIANQVLGSSTPRKWMFPPLSGWNGNLNSVSNIGMAFDRDGINLRAKQQHTGGGSIGHSAAYSMQLSILAGKERAFRARHLTIVRAIAHAAGRRNGHGNASGIHTGTTLKYITNLHVAGGSKIA